MPGNILTCYTCHHLITSDIHKEKCITIHMYDKKECNLKELTTHKSMMTYGLCGCTAFILYIKSNNKIVMGHHPEKNIIMKWLNEYLQDLSKNISANNEVSLYIRLPQEYEKQPNGKYDYKKTNIFDIYKDHPHIKKLIIEPYSLNNDNSKYSLKSTLYCKLNILSTENYKIEYSDSYGKWCHLS